MDTLPVELIVIINKFNNDADIIRFSLTQSKYYWMFHDIRKKYLEEPQAATNRIRLWFNLSKSLDHIRADRNLHQLCKICCYNNVALKSDKCLNCVINIRISYYGAMYELFINNKIHDCDFVFDAKTIYEELLKINNEYIINAMMNGNEIDYRFEIGKKLKYLIRITKIKKDINESEKLLKLLEC